uniref:Uncharacterized protein n=1 Tax=Globisporangium ultimum (strain ATCC 200006 / CBS 805.95 / DAOM BR144) TaxID=431595 RepID=K3WKW8_GLOUD
MQPLYRRGPAFSAPAAYDSQWPLQHLYGPPDDRMRSPRDASRAFDYELFSIYFLIAESLSTYVGYRITQHCLRGCRVTFLSPTTRLLIGVLYCSMKIKIIDYTFHGSAYYMFSLLIMIWYFAYATLALGFHFGPLQFLFYDYIPRSKMTQSLFHKLASLCAKVSTRLELYVLQHLCMPPPANTPQEVNTSTLQMMAEKSEPTAYAKHDHAQPPLPGFSRISLVFGRVVDVQIDMWNRSMYQQWSMTLITSARRSAVRVRDLLDVFECRYMFVMQQDGLLLGFFMAEPTATMMTKLRTGCATPFELILRFHVGADDNGVHHVKPVFLYAESPLLAGRSSNAQKTSIYQLLSELNNYQGRKADVPLRSLRCKNFVESGSGQIVKKKSKQRNMFSDFESSFG